MTNYIPMWESCKCWQHRGCISQQNWHGRCPAVENILSDQIVFYWTLCDHLILNKISLKWHVCPIFLPQRATLSLEPEQFSISTDAEILSAKNRWLTQFFRFYCIARACQSRLSCSNILKTDLQKERTRSLEVNVLCGSISKLMITRMTFYLGLVFF